ncbi:phosphoribosyltransferase [Glutamicibacter sp. TV12E]|uniref:phosphoribosyltransferase n=1 Tax=Glutamicibacter sp. TV12E TaxID=3446362 RepID=UPI004034E53A
MNRLNFWLLLFISLTLGKTGTMVSENSSKFDDRSHAGAALGMKLATTLPAGEYTVLGLLRGGVPIAYEVAQALGARLGVLAVRKLGVPNNPELAFGAIAQYSAISGRYLNAEVHRRALQYFGPEELASVENGTHADLLALAHAFRAYAPDLAGQSVILCDDGIATGATMKASLELVAQLHPQSIIIASPVIAPETLTELAPLADGLVELLKLHRFGAVGAFYKDFSQVDQDNVLKLLGAGS